MAAFCRKRRLWPTWHSCAELKVRVAPSSLTCPIWQCGEEQQAGALGPCSISVRCGPGMCAALTWVYAVVSWEFCSPGPYTSHPFDLGLCMGLGPSFAHAHLFKHQLFRENMHPSCTILAPLPEIIQPSVQELISGPSVPFRRSLCLPLYQYHTVLGIGFGTMPIVGFFFMYYF